MSLPPKLKRYSREKRDSLLAVDKTLGEIIS